MKYALFATAALALSGATPTMAQTPEMFGAWELHRQDDMCMLLRIDGNGASSFITGSELAEQAMLVNRNWPGSAQSDGLVSVKVMFGGGAEPQNIESKSLFSDDLGQSYFVPLTFQDILRAPTDAALSFHLSGKQLVSIPMAELQPGMLALAECGAELAK